MKYIAHTSSPLSSQTLLRPRFVFRWHFLVSVIGTLYWFFLRYAMFTTWCLPRGLL